MCEMQKASNYKLIKTSKSCKKVKSYDETFSIKYLELPPESFNDHVNSLHSNLGTFIEFLVMNHVDTYDKLIFNI